MKFETRNSKLETMPGDRSVLRRKLVAATAPSFPGARSSTRVIRHSLLSNFEFRFSSFLLLLLLAVSARAVNFGPEIVISVRDQQLAVIENGRATGTFPISTSRFGVGDTLNSYKTPLGLLWVYDKIGANLPAGAVIKNRSATGEVIPANARGRDPIVTRIIWLKGLFGGTTHAFERCIYIHGTPEESTLGHPVSWGCIRMRSADVLRVYDKVEIGTHVLISNDPLKKLIRAESANTLDTAST